MVGQLYVPGEQKVLSGVYFRRTDIGTPAIAGATTGRLAAIFRAPWGPLATPQLTRTLAEVEQYFGSGLGVDVPVQGLLGKAAECLCMRVGDDGAAGARIAVDTTGAGAINAVTITNKYVGDRAIYSTIRNSPSDVTLREFLVWELIAGVYTLRETITFLAGAGGGGEPQKLTDAIMGVTPGKTASRWVTAAKIADGNGILAAYSQQAHAGGANPAAIAIDYTNAMTALAAYPWDVLVVDTADASILTSVRAYVDALRANGVLVMASIGEPTSVALATRQANSAAHNDPPVVYWGNGFNTSDGIAAEGYLAAARMGGKIAGTPSNQAITWSVVDGATSVIGPLDIDEQIASKNSGMNFFNVDPDGNVVAAEGITTFHVATADLDLGWAKIRRVRARDELMRRIGRSWAATTGRLNNNADGRSTLLGMAQAVAAQMVAEQKLVSANIAQDPAYPPAGDTATFVAEIVDLDSLEKVYMAFGFQFGGQ